MAAQVLGGRLHDEVHAVVHHRVVEARAPGVVGDHEGALRVRRAADGRHVLDLEGERARALHVHHRGVGLHERGHLVAGGERVVVGGLDAELRQRVVAEVPRRPVDGVDHEHVVARLHDRHDRHRHRREPRGHGHRAVAALQRRRPVPRRRSAAACSRCRRWRSARPRRRASASRRGSRGESKRTVEARATGRFTVPGVCAALRPPWTSFVAFFMRRRPRAPSRGGSSPPPRSRRWPRRSTPRACPPPRPSPASPCARGRWAAPRP